MAGSNVPTQDDARAADPRLRRRLGAVALIVAGAAVMLLGATVTVRAMTGFFATVLGHAQSSAASVTGFAGTARAFFESMAAIAFTGPFTVVWGAIGFAVMVGGFALILHAITVLTGSSREEAAYPQIEADREGEESSEDAAHAGREWVGQPAEASSRTARR